MVAFFTNPFRVIFEKFYFITAVGAFGLKNGTRFPVATVLAGTFHVSPLTVWYNVQLSDSALRASTGQAALYLILQTFNVRPVRLRITKFVRLKFEHSTEPFTYSFIPLVFICGSEILVATKTNFVFSCKRYAADSQYLIAYSLWFSLVSPSDPHPG